MLFSFALLIAGSAPTMPVFVSGRAVQGLGAGMINVALYALVGGVVPEDRRPEIFAYFAAAWVLPAMVGPAISGLMLHAVGWRPVFLLIPALAVPAVLAMLTALRGQVEPPAPARTERAVTDGVRRRVLLALGAGVGAAALQVAGSRAELPWRLAAVVALAAVLGCVVPLLPRGTFRLERGVPAVVAVRGLISAAFVAAEAFLPLLLVRERGWAPGVAGLMLTAGAVAWSSTAWIQGRTAEVAGRYRFARVGTLLLVVGVSLCFLAALPGMSGGLVVAGWGVAGAGMGFVYSSTSVLVLHLSPSERHGEASSALTTSEALAASVALAAAGALFAALLPAGISARSPAGAAPYLAGIGVGLVAAVGSAVGAVRLRARPQPS